MQTYRMKACDLDMKHCHAAIFLTFSLSCCPVIAMARGPMATAKITLAGIEAVLTALAGAPTT